ncbi:putative membrane protein [Pedobacter sp. UYP24]
MKLQHLLLQSRIGKASNDKHPYQNLGKSERLISVFFGGLLLGRYITRPFKTPFLYGAYLTYRGATGKCLFYEQLGIDASTSKAINIRGEFEVDKSAAELYAYWRNLENLPGSLKHLANVKVIDGQISQWKSNLPGKLFNLHWEAEIVKDEPGRLIGWSSLPGSFLKHVGRVTFEEKADGTGTIMKVVFSYHPPAGGLGMTIAKLVNPYLEALLDKEMSTFRFKR